MTENQVKNRSEVLDRLKSLRQEIRQLGVRRLGLFGSFNRDAADESSDVDLIVEFREGAKSYDSLFSLSELLEEELGRTVELVTPESLDPEVWHSLEDEVDYVQGPENVTRSENYEGTFTRSWIEVQMTSSRVPTNDYTG